MSHQCWPEGAAARIREFFDCHAKPFLNATPISGQAHTFVPDGEGSKRFSVTVSNAFLLIASKGGHLGQFYPVPRSVYICEFGSLLIPQRWRIHRQDQTA